jgi:hypothetical protein
VILIDDTTGLPISVIAPIHGDDPLLTHGNRKSGKLWLLERDRSGGSGDGRFISKEGRAAASRAIALSETDLDSPGIQLIVDSLARHWSAGNEGEAVVDLLREVDLGAARRALSAMLIASGYDDHELAIW